MRVDPFPAEPAPAPATRLTPSERSWRDHVRAFARERVAPRSADMDAKAALDPELRAELFAEGLLSVSIPPEYGGLGGSLVHVLITVEEIARVDPGVAVGVDVHDALVVPAILAAGTGDQRRRYLPAMATGRIGAFALSEEHAGSDAFALSTRARPVDGGLRLTGRKRWTSNADNADVFCVFARGPAKEHISAYLVDRDSPGLRVDRRTEQLGVRAAATADLVLDGVPVRSRHCLGGPGGGRALAARTLDVGRLGIAAQLVGLATGALRLAAGYAGERSQFGRPIGEYQAVQFTLAELATQLAAARALLYDTARAVASGDLDPAAAMGAAAMAKLFASRAAERIAAAAVDVHGGNGFTRAYPIERLYRDAKVGTIYEGTTNMLLRTISGARAGALADEPAGADL